MRVRPVGESALLIELDELDGVLALSSALRAHPPDGLVEAVPAARTVLLHCDLRISSLMAITEALGRIQPAAPRPPDEQSVEIPASYDGPDIDDVLATTGLTRRKLIDWHTGADWQVAFCGFSPGFGYLVSDGAHPVPRRDSPRTRVPAGSIGLAGEFSGIYPRASPGGWQLIGRTDATLFDLEADPPALLRPGVCVRFVDDT